MSTRVWVSQQHQGQHLLPRAFPSSSRMTEYLPYVQPMVIKETFHRRLSASHSQCPTLLLSSHDTNVPVETLLGPVGL